MSIVFISNKPNGYLDKSRIECNGISNSRKIDLYIDDLPDTILLQIIRRLYYG